MGTDAITRRIFLKQTAALGAAVAAGTMASCAAGLKRYQSQVSDGKLVVDITQYPELAVAGGAILVSITGNGDALILTRTSDTGFRALSPICTHLGCEVRPTRFGFRCPCHGSAYDHNGRVVNGPANEPLSVYPVTVEGTRVEITIQG